MTYDLRREAWLPFRRRSGEIVWGLPSLLTDQIETNPVVALAASRADFNGAVLEFLIGLFTAAFEPEDEAAWRTLWHQPPQPEALQASIDSLPDAFDLDGDGVRFLQDVEPADLSDGRENPIEALLMDAPGQKTARLNKDMFVKRDRVTALGRPAIAMALLTLQTYAPSGGQGHRTSMRGGGPLTTLIEPRVHGDGSSVAHEQPLWRKIWANVETVEQWEARGPDTADGGPKLIYPWLTRTRTSDPKSQGRATTEQDGHPLQVYFGMPRRIRINFEAGEVVCDLTGREEAVFARTFHATNYGVEYSSWRHPLSPYYREKTGGWLPIHGQSEGIGWRDWGSLVFETPEGGKRPSLAVAHFSERRASRIGIQRPRLHAFGYDMDNMKARGWIEAELPAFALADPEKAETLSRIAADLTEAGNHVASALRIAIKAAWFQRPKEAKGDFSFIAIRFWAETEGAFFLALEPILAADAPRIDIEITVKNDFLKPLEQVAISIFDELCPMEALEFINVRRLVVARHELRRDLQGVGKIGAKIFKALALPPPQNTKINRKKEEKVHG